MKANQSKAILELRIGIVHFLVLARFAGESACGSNDHKARPWDVSSQ